KISKMVATENAISAGVELIHSKFVDNVTQDTFAAKLVINNGVNTRNPAEALKPIPIKIAITISKIFTPSLTVVTLYKNGNPFKFLFILFILNRYMYQFHLADLLAHWRIQKTTSSALAPLVLSLFYTLIIVQSSNCTHRVRRKKLLLKSKDAHFI